MQQIIHASIPVRSRCWSVRVCFDVGRILGFIILFCANSWAQPLDGARLDLHVNGGVQSYRLVAETTPNAQNEPTASVTQTANGNAQNEPNDIPGDLRVALASPVAPASVHVNAMQIPMGADDSPLNVKYEWDFGDPTAARNALVGFNAAHVYDRAGTYTITLKLTNSSGVVRTLSANVSIQKDKRRTIYAEAFNFDAALKLLDDDTRMLLKRGDRFAVGGTIKIPFRNVLIGAYGDESAPPPMLVWTGIKNGTMIEPAQGADSLLIENLQFASGASVATAAAAIRLSGQNVAIRRCAFDRVYDAINGNGNPIGVMIEDNVANADVSGYFVWVGGSDYVIVGNQTKGVGLHDIRMNDYRRVLIFGNTLHNKTRSAIGAQTGEYVWIADNAITGAILANGAVTGTVNAGPLGSDDALKHDPLASIRRTRFAVIEKNRLQTSQITVLDGAEQVVVRDNEIHLDGKTAISVDGYEPKFKRGVNDVLISGNKAINRNETGQFLKIVGSARDVTLRGNVYVAPNLRPGASATAVVYVAGDDLSCFRYVGGNVWPASLKTLSYAQGGYHYVWPGWSDEQGYRTPDEWRELGAKDERYENVPAPIN